MVLTNKAPDEDKSFVVILIHFSFQYFALEKTCCCKSLLLFVSFSLLLLMKHLNLDFNLDFCRKAGRKWQVSGPYECTERSRMGC